MLLLAGLFLFLAQSDNLTRAEAAKPPTSGRDIFRYDTFGDEQLWTDVLGMQKVVAQLTPAQRCRSD
jgi:hypothetical protein